MKSYYVDNRGFFVRPFSILGRIGRKEYIFSYILFFAIYIYGLHHCAGITLCLGDGNNDNGYFIAGCLCVYDNSNH